MIMYYRGIGFAVNTDKEIAHGYKRLRKTIAHADCRKHQ